jgi:transcriptional regulator with GAF, ATPase, and Fis domain
VVAAVWDSKEVIVSSNAMVDSRFNSLMTSDNMEDTIILQKLLSVACAPLTHENKTFGVIYIDNRNKEAVFDSNTGKLLKGLADLISEALVKSLEYTLKRRKETQHLQQHIRELREEVDRLKGYDKILGNSPAMKNVYELIERSKNHNFNVLITGESGTGKELIARACHNNSPRKDKPMITVNCAALPTNLVESELFGHKKGAFTGAIENKVGRFELADGGTIFLDEIGDLPLESQAKLLRVLQEGEIQRVGDSRTIEVDVRIIAATNRDLKKAVKEREFREDLYYRITEGIKLTLPPLKERGKDILIIANHVLEELNKEYKKNVKGFSTEAEQALLHYSFPGNVRDLRRIVKNAYIYADTDIIELEDLQPVLNENISLTGSGDETIDFSSSTADTGEIYANYLPEEYRDQIFIWGKASENSNQDSKNTDMERELHDKILVSVKNATGIPLKDALKAVGLAFERNYIIEKLITCNGKLTDAYKQSGVDKKTLIEKIKQHSLKREWYVE